MVRSKRARAIRVEERIVSGAMDDDMAELVHRFRSGAKISIKSDPVYPIWGLCEPVVGKVCASFVFTFQTFAFSVGYAR